MTVTVAAGLSIRAVPGVPVAAPGDDLAALALAALTAAEIALADCDVLVVCSKLASRVEGRFRDLQRVEPSPRARELAAASGGDPRVVELVLGESERVSRVARGALVVRHRLGLVSANASIDASNAAPPGAAPGTGPWVLLLPADPDRTARALRDAVAAATGARVGVVITDSLGRPFRLGTVGAAVGVAGVPALVDQRGERDLFGRPLEHTFVAVADQIAAAADLVAGQASEGRPLIHVRGLSFSPREATARDLVRPVDEDLYL